MNNFRLLIIYLRGFRRGYFAGPGHARLTSWDLTSVAGKAEWYGITDGIAFRVRLGSRPFCRQCGNIMVDSDRPYRYDPNLGTLCRKCGDARHEWMGEKLLSGQ